MVLIGISPPAYPTLPQSCECMIPSSFMLSYLFPGEEIIRHYSDTTNFSCLFEVSTKKFITVHHNPTLLEKETEQNKSNSLRESTIQYVRCASNKLLSYDITNRQSFENTVQWIEVSWSGVGAGLRLDDFTFFGHQRVFLSGPVWYDFGPS